MDFDHLVDKNGKVIYEVKMKHSKEKDLSIIFQVCFALSMSKFVSA